MSPRSTTITASPSRLLREVGRQIRDRRKLLGLSSVVVAESAGMSRVTLYRIEQGQASVAMGAYLSVIAVLGLRIDLIDNKTTKSKSDHQHKALPEKIRIANYKQLKRLAWQLKDSKELSPKDALDLYERNWRHIDTNEMDSRERNLAKALLAAFGRERLLV